MKFIKCVFSNLQLSACKRFASSANSVLNTTTTASKPVSSNVNLELSQCLPDFKSIAIKYEKSSKAASNAAQITTLENGLRIASKQRYGLNCTLGALISAGPKFESKFPKGVSHMIEKVAFQSTKSFASRDEIQSEVEKCGAIFDCQIDKDLMVYGLAGAANKLDKLLRVLLETIFQPRLTQDEVAMAQQFVQFEEEARFMFPPPDGILSDLIQNAAFGDQSYGIRKFCAPENAHLIDRNQMLRFMRWRYRPENMVISCVGVEHEFLVDAVNAVMPEIIAETSWSASDSPSSSPPLSASSQSVSNEEDDAIEDHNTAQYRGGIQILPRDLRQYHSPMPEFAHLVIGLPAFSIRHDKHFVTSFLLEKIMGGGSSFSAGGPGKGMYSRLYIDFLNLLYWVNSAQATLFSYQDAALFTLSGSCEPEHLHNLFDALRQQLQCMTMRRRLTNEELKRAKCQLQSQLMMNLEMHASIFEDIGRQTLYTGKHLGNEHWLERIESISAEDVIDLAETMMSQKLSVAAFGNVDSLQIEKIQKLQSA